MIVACVPITADPVVAGHPHRPAHGGLDDLDHRHAVPLAGVAQHRGARRVAGDDQHLHTVVHEVIHDVEGVLAHLRQGPGTVRSAGGVADVHDGLVRQLVEHCAGDGQPADAGVEDAQTGRPALMPKLPGDRPARRPPECPRTRRSTGTSSPPSQTMKQMSAAVPGPAARSARPSAACRIAPVEMPAKMPSSCSSCRVRQHGVVRARPSTASCQHRRRRTARGRIPRRGCAGRRPTRRSAVRRPRSATSGLCSRR